MRGHVCAVVGIARVWGGGLAFQFLLAEYLRSEFGLQGSRGLSSALLEQARAARAGGTCAPGWDWRAWMRFFRSKFGLQGFRVLSSAWLEQAHAARAEWHVCARVGLRACVGILSF